MVINPGLDSGYVGEPALPGDMKTVGYHLNFCLEIVTEPGELVGTFENSHSQMIEFPGQECYWKE